MSDFVKDPFENPSDDQGSHLNREDFLDGHQLASKGQRFANYFIDVIAFYVIILTLGGLFLGGLTEAAMDPSMGFVLNLLFIGGWLGYYTIMEATTGKTLGKMVTGTKVIRDQDGGKPSWGQALGRAAARLVPFEFISIFISAEGVMWHDKWPNTKVIKGR